MTGLREAAKLSPIPPNIKILLELFAVPIRVRSIRLSPSVTQEDLDPYREISGFLNGLRTLHLQKTRAGHANCRPMDVLLLLPIN